MSTFKNKHTFEKRQNESQRIQEKYPDRFAIIVEKSNSCKVLPEIDKNKYLVPKDLVVGQFTYILRKRLKIGKETSIFLFCNKMLPPTSISLEHFLKDKQDPDGFYYFTYSGENTFGDSLSSYIL